ncbi:plexin domain-containing protein 2-like isoform X2 [Ostrea edulis]|uniref:plexin domain-containing protein 2-like isoform X2 n=1 Tax=Ostrea edulis TaxID=37623 RepID=UPI0024AED40B|nr:plexin domain-containing protein 2-like isoform X2 [Ostrea edulis]
MATTKWVILESVVIVTFFICSHVKLTYSKDVSYMLHDSEIELDSVISFRSHHTLHKRQTLNNATTGSPTSPPTTTPQYTEQEVSQHHKYYTSKVVSGSAKFGTYWDELFDVKHSEPLSGSHRVAVSVPISFRFKFYGHDVSKVTIATGGFLYMSPFLHQWLTATQYIAPLMANFDTSVGNDSVILYKDFGDRFVVEWRELFLQDQNHTNPFSFQTTLHSNGTIYFAYKEIPVEVFNIEMKNHPVKVGVSDAFYIDTIQGGIQRRTIFEYHRVEVNFTRIRSNTVIILEPLQTCNLATDCNSCLTQKDSFDCKWCPQVSRCSDGMDWLRQEWRDKGCEIQAFNKLSRCSLSTTTLSTSTFTRPAKKPSVQPDCSAFDNPAKCSTTTAEPPTTPTPKPTINTLIPTSKVQLTTTHKLNMTTTHKLMTTTHKLMTTRTKPMTTTPRSMTTTTKPMTTTPKPMTTTTPKPMTTTPTQFSSPSHQQDNGCMPGSSRSNCSLKDSSKSDKNATIAGVVIAVIILVALVVGIGGWFFYAYTHPTSASGQWMINHRPSEMKAKMNKMKFWKRDTASGEKYRVESTA